MVPENRSLVPAEVVTANLARRDLESCIQPSILPERRAPRFLGIKLYDPNFWDKVGYWIDRWLHGRKESPTYNIITDRVDGFQLLLALAESKAIRANSVRDVADGWMRIAAIDQLAISNLPEKTVLQLDHDGFGLWPVRVDQDFSDVDWDKLRVELTKEQLEVLKQAQNSQTRAIRGLWFQDERLTSDNPPIPQDYLPTAVEILKAFETFYDQEGFYPHSKGRWFFTRSSLQSSLYQTFEDVFSKMSTDEILREVFIRQSYAMGEIRRYLSMVGDFDLARSGGGNAKRKGDKLELSNSQGYVNFRQQRDNIFVYTRSGREIEIKDGTFIAKNNQGHEIARLPYKTLTNEIEVSLAKAKSIFEQPISFPVILFSDRKEGVNMGISVEGSSGRVNYRLANGTLNFNVLSVLRPFIDQQFHNLDVSEYTYWPRIFPDPYAGYLYQ